MSTYKHILSAVDLSEDSKPVARRALELQGLGAARLSLLHVVEPVPIDMPDDFILPERAELEDYVVETARDKLNRFAEELGIPEQARFLEMGSAKTEIARFAEDNGVDLIVLGSHGRHGLQLLLGSTANAVLHVAPCDVLAVRVRGV
jgi:universal stress protein A